MEKLLAFSRVFAASLLELSTKPAIKQEAEMKEEVAHRKTTKWWPIASAALSALDMH